MNTLIKGRSKKELAFFCSIILTGLAHSYPSPVINTDRADTYKSELITSNPSNTLATITFNNLYHLPGTAEIHFGDPSSPYDDITHIIGSLGSNRTYSLMHGTRVVVSYSPYMALRCLYFDVIGSGNTRVDFYANMHLYTSFRVINTNVIKPIFNSEFNYIESNDDYKCPWPSPS